MLSRAIILSGMFICGLAAPSTRAHAPLPARFVEDELATAAGLAEPQSLLRVLALLPHLDALAPDATLTALRALSQGASLRAARVRLELAAALGEPAPDHPLVRGLGVAVLTPDGDLLSQHRELASAGSAVAGATWDPDDAERRWSPLGEGPVGALDLEPLVPEGGQVVLHLVVPFELAAPFDGYLRLGASGDLVASLAGPAAGPLGQASGLSRAAPDQLELALSLPPGRHVLLVSLRPSTSEPAQFRARLDGRGATPAIAQALESAAWSPLAPGAAFAPLPWNKDVSALGTSVDGLVLARLLGLPDRARLEERLAARLPEPRALLLALGAVPRAEDRASLLLGALEARRCPRCARDPALLVALAEHTAERGQLVQAGQLLDEAAASGQHGDAITWSKSRTARLAHAPEEVLVTYGVATPELSGQASLARLAPAPERVLLEVAQAALELGRAEVALALTGALAERWPGRLDLGALQARAALLAGRSDLSAELTLALAERRADRPALALDAAARLLTRGLDGDRPRARALLTRTMPRIQWKPDALVDAARLFERLEDSAAAATAYQRALAVSPAHDGARTALERLQGGEPVPLTLDVDAVAGAPVTDPNASFEVLGEEQYVRVRADGSATRWTRRILRAQTVPEAREARTLTIRFDPTQESVRVLGASVRRAADGPVTSRTLAEPVPDRLLQSIAEDWYGLYYDLRQLAIPFDHLARGDVIEVTWRVDPTGQLFPGVVDLFETLLDRVPKHRHRIVVETPPGIALTTRLSVPDGVQVAAREEEVALADGGRRHVVELNDLPALPAEALAPGTAEVSPVWQATTFTSWREVATWYRRLVEPQKVLTPAMKAFVAEARAGRVTDNEILARLTDYVTREIRYVGLEFGIHGYKPYRSDHVWERRFGDCKDKATLLSALLAEAGLTGEVTLLRTRKQGRLRGALPSLALFDHAVVYLPGRDELFDPTATHFGLGELPKEDQGAQILVLAAADRPVNLAESRVDPPTRNGVMGTYSVALEAGGRAGIQGTVAFLGTQAPAYRALLLDTAAQMTRLAELMNRRFPGLSLRDYRVSDPRDRSRPMELVFHAEVPRFGQLQAGEGAGTLQIVRPTGIDGHLERYASDDARRLPLVLGPPMSWDVTYRYILPAGHRARGLPSDAEGAGPYGQYRVRWLDEGQVVSVRVELSYLVDQVEVAEYPGLRDFVRAFDAAVAPPLVLERAARDKPGPGPTATTTSTSPEPPAVSP